MFHNPSGHDCILGRVQKIQYMGVSKNRGTPKSSILIGFSLINHPFWDTPIFGNTHFPSSQNQKRLEGLRTSSTLSHRTAWAPPAERNAKKEPVTFSQKTNRAGWKILCSIGNTSSNGKLLDYTFFQQGWNITIGFFSGSF